MAITTTEPLPAAAKALADDVQEAVVRLNAALANAHAGGLMVGVDYSERQQIQDRWAQKVFRAEVFLSLR